MSEEELDEMIEAAHLMNASALDDPQKQDLIKWASPTAMALTIFVVIRDARRLQAGRRHRPSAHS